MKRYRRNNPKREKPGARKLSSPELNTIVTLKLVYWFYKDEILFLNEVKVYFRPFLSPSSDICSI